MANVNGMFPHNRIVLSSAGIHPTEAAGRRVSLIRIHTGVRFPPVGQLRYSYNGIISGCHPEDGSSILPTRTNKEGDQCMDTQSVLNTDGL